jgi:hypothetical protein
VFGVNFEVYVPEAYCWLMLDERFVNVTIIEGKVLVSQLEHQ